MNHLLLERADLCALWQQFKERGCQQAREQLIEGHVHLVTITAGRLFGSLPAATLRDDLVGSGYVGLIKAVDNYDPARGVKFQTYAIALIRGAILESLREDDWVPRSVRDRAKQMAQVEQAFEKRTGRAPTDEELEAQLGWTPAMLQHERGLADRMRQMSLSAPTTDDADTPLHLEDALVAEGASPWQQAWLRQRTQLLQQAIAWLPARERRIVRLYYDAGKTFKEIGRLLCISESRVYQLHAQATRRMRQLLGEDWDERNSPSERNSPRWRAEV